jgi:hypothetical protein
VDNVVDSDIRELDADGNMVWEWTSVDHFSPAETTFPQRFDRYGLTPAEVDLIHVNSMQRVDDGTGDYVVSARHLDAVFRVDRQSPTGAVKWILGSLPSDPAAAGYVPNLSGAPRLEIIGDPFNGPRRQHDARLEGDILTMFDNRTATGQPARVVKYRIDEAAGTATMVSEIRQPAGLTSGALGSARYAPDGSVLVNWGQLQPMFTELDAFGNTLLSITSGVGTFRAIKVPPSAFTLADLRANAGGSLDEP